MSNRVLYIFIFLIAAILYLPALGIVPLFDWDEINFAEISREMIVSGNYARMQVEFQPFWEKPPLFFWLQTSAMHFLGINEYAARLPNALMGIITLLTLFHIGKKIQNRQFALLWILAYAGSFTPAFYFKSGIIDPLFNYFIFLSIFQLHLLTTLPRDKKVARYRQSFWGGLWLGLAVLTKGPVAVFLVGLCGLIYWIMSRSLRTFKLLELLVYALVLVLVASIWFIPEIMSNGFWFVNEFIEYQIGLATVSEDTGHEQPFWYHPVVLLLGCFPASIFFLGALRRSNRDDKAQGNFKRWMHLQFWVTLIVFSIVKAKIIHYSSLCYFPLTYLAADFVYKVWQGEYTYPRWLDALFIFIGAIWGLVLILVPLFPYVKDSVVPYVDDPFAVANFEAQVYWSGFEILIGVFFLLSLIYALWQGNQQNGLKKAIVLYISTLITLQLTLYIIVPKVERYTQGALIDFLKSVQKEDCYISPYNFQSYAHHYYGTVTPAQARSKDQYLESFFGKKLLAKETYGKLKAKWNEWLLHGKIDRPAYMILKVSKDRNLMENEKKWRKVMDKNGFLVYKREVEK